MLKSDWREKAGCIEIHRRLFFFLHFTVKILQHDVTAGEMFRHDRVGAWYRPLLSLGEALFYRPPSLGPRVEPPCRVQSGWERNALGCGAAPTLGNQRNNSHSMDSNDPYLHLSKYASRIYSELSLPVVFLAKLQHFVWTYEERVRSFHGVFSTACELCAKASADFNHGLPSVNPFVMLLSLLILVLQLCRLKRKLRPIQKSGDRCCAGQARSEVGTLIALM